MTFSFQINSLTSKLSKAIKLSGFLLSLSFATSSNSQDSCTTVEDENIQNWPQDVSLFKIERALASLSMKVKPGSQLENISPLWLRLFQEIKRSLPGLPITWVSGLEGQSHRRKSTHHYDGEYLDLRIKDWPMVIIEKRKVVEGRELIAEALKNLNNIKGLKAELIEEELFPFIELHIIKEKTPCQS